MSHRTLLLAFIGISFITTPNYTHAKQPNRDPTISEVAQITNSRYTGIVGQVDSIAQQITVRISTPDNPAHGSGVIIAKQDNTYYIATARHVVEDKQPDKIVTSDGIKHQLDLTTIEASDTYDLAIFSFQSDKDYQVATLGKYGVSANQDRVVFVSGFPKLDNKQPQRMITGGKVRLENEKDFSIKDSYSLQKQGEGLIYSNLSYGGMSGGAVLDREGRLIGIHTASENEFDDNTLTEFSLGFSLGVPIRDALAFFHQTQLNVSSLALSSNPAKQVKEAEWKDIESQLLTTTQPKSEEIAALMNYGNQLWRYERYDEAINTFQQVIKLDPKYDRAHYGMGLAYRSQGGQQFRARETTAYRQSYQKAVSAFQQATEINSTPYYYWRWLGFSYAELEQYDRALAAYDRAIEKNKKQERDFVLYQEQGDVLRRDKQYQAAIEAYTQAAKIKPNHPWIYVNRGYAYADLKQYDKAIADYSKAIELNPLYDYPHNNRGTIYADLKQYDKAIADYKKAIELNPENDKAYLNLGITYKDLKQYDKAINNWTQTIKINPKFAGAYYNRGTVLYNLKKYKQAISDLTKAIKIDPDFADAYNNRGVSYKNLEQFDLAIENFDQVIALNPNDAGAYFNRANSYSGLKQYQNAIVDHTKAIALDLQYADAYGNRGSIYSILQQYSKAISDYTKALEINPQDSETQVQRALSYFFLEEYDHAVEDFTKAIALDPQNAQNYQLRGQAYGFAKQYEQAISNYTKAVEIDPQFAQAYFERGLYYAITKNYDLARQDTEKARDLFQDKDDTKGYQSALELLKQIEEVENKNKLKSLTDIKSKYTGIVGRVDNIARQITVRIATSDNPSHGSGVIIAKQNNTYYVATAKHVVNDKQQYQIVTSDEEKHQLDVATIENSDAYDLAIFSFESDKNHQVASFGKTDKDGRQVIFVSGFPKLNNQQPQRTITGGKLRKDDVKDFISKDTYSLQDGQGLVYSNISYGGMSGGAVLDSEGRLIGIHTASENEIDNNTANQFSLGYSLGVSIQDVLGWLKTRLNSQQLTLASNPATEVSEKDWENIENQLLTTTQPNHQEITAWMNYGNQLWRYVRFDEAIEAYNKVIELDPNFDKAYYAMGLIYIFQGDPDFQKAVASFKKATQINPQPYYYWRWLGSSYEGLKQYEPALTAYDHAISLNSEDFILYVERGDTLSQAKRYTEAIESYSQGIVLNPNHPWAYLNRAISYDKLGQRDQAIADYTKVIEINPSLYDQAYVNRGVNYDNLQQYNQTIADYTKAIEINPSNIVAHSNRGAIYSRLQQYDKAITDFERAIEINPQYAAAYNNRGIAYAQLEQYDKAIIDFERAIEIDPKYAEAHSNLGIAYALLKQNDKAITYLNKAIKINPQYAGGYKIRGSYYYILKNLQQTRQDWKQAAKLYKQQHNNQEYQLMLEQLEKLNN